MNVVAKLRGSGQLPWSIRNCERFWCHFSAVNLEVLSRLLCEINFHVLAACGNFHVLACGGGGVIRAQHASRKEGGGQV
jgi:hypothetical protein